jgi:hypothetical protein
MKQFSSGLVAYYLPTALMIRCFKIMKSARKTKSLLRCHFTSGSCGPYYWAITFEEPLIKTTSKKRSITRRATGSAEQDALPPGELFLISKNDEE